MKYIPAARGQLLWGLLPLFLHATDAPYCLARCLCLEVTGPLDTTTDHFLRPFPRPAPRHIGSPDNALGPLPVDRGRLPQGRLSPPPHQQAAFLPHGIPLTPCYHRAISKAVVFQVFKLRAGKMPLCVWLSFLSTSLLAFPTTGN